MHTFIRHAAASVLLLACTGYAEDQKPPAPSAAPATEGCPCEEETANEANAMNNPGPKPAIQIADAKPGATPANPAVPAAPASKIEDLSKLSKEELAKRLDKEAYYVCIMGGTEKPFQNKYWNNHEPGIYVDVISGKPLFASTTKFESGSGWPSFFTPIDKNEIKQIEDRSHGMVRTEVVAKTSGAHLGHVFDDGPKPTGLRYCINSAALKFVHKDKLKEMGLEQYLSIFTEEKK